MTHRDWDAKAYHDLSAPQVEWGTRLLEQMSLHGDEHALDAGCGTGRLTQSLRERLPEGSVVGLDHSRQMLDEARRLLGPAVPLVCASLPDVPMRAAFNLVFSTATFHWVHDHGALFRNLYDALAPGGRLIAQCGGGANLARVHARAQTLMQAPPYATWFAGWTPAWNFADAEETATRLSAAGFTDVRTSLRAAPVVLEDPDRYHAFLTTVIFRDHLRYLPDEGLRHRFVASLTEQGAEDRPPLSLDYWRLNMAGRKRGQS